MGLELAIDSRLEMGVAYMRKMVNGGEPPDQVRSMTCGQLSSDVPDNKLLTSHWLVSVGHSKKKCPAPGSCATTVMAPPRAIASTLHHPDILTDTSPTMSEGYCLVDMSLVASSTPVQGLLWLL